MTLLYGLLDLLAVFVVGGVAVWIMSRWDPVREWKAYAFALAFFLSESALCYLGYTVTT